MDIEQYIRGATSKLSARLIREQEQALINFFGSREEADRLAPYFVIELDPVTVTPDCEDSDATTLRAEMNYRIRLRRPEEY